MLVSKNSIELLEGLENENLLEKLILQLNKDFYLANIDEQFQTSITIISLKSNLHKIVYSLFNTSYDDYLNLLYRVDVSEKELSKIREKDIVAQIDQVVFLILKREYQKVWFKSRT